MSNGNFLFLTERFPALEKMGSLAESYLYADPNACMYKMGALAETMVNYIFDADGYTPPSGNNNTQANRVKVLQKAGLLTDDINNIFYKLRVNRNEAVHAGFDSFEECVTLIEMAFTLSVWFMQVYGDPAFEPAPFVLPYDIRNMDGYQKLLEENERLLADLEKAIAAAPRHQHAGVHESERRRRAEQAGRRVRLSEREVRSLIDERLRGAGWEADSLALRYSRGARPEEGRNLAIAEWPTDLALCRWGYADYALFTGLTLVGVVEANADRRDVASALGVQCREYSMSVKEEHTCYLADGWEEWGGYKAPFLFATNGRAYQRELAPTSGVWFRDARSDENEPAALQDWYGPQELAEMMNL